MMLFVMMLTMNVQTIWAQQTSGTCSKTENDNVTWAVTDKDNNGTYETITISGTGAMADYGTGGQPWVAFRSDITTAVIGEGVTSIGNDAFYNCINLTSATFAEGSLLESIGRSAFYSCKSLTEITIPEEVTFVGEYAFASCDNLKKCTLLGSKVIFEDYVFESFGGEPSLYASLEALSSYHDRFQEMHVSNSKIVGMLTAKEGEPGEYWTSFCSAYYHEVPSDAKIYKAAVSGTKLVLTELTNDKVVNSGQTVIMKTTSPAILLPVSTSNGQNDFSGNQLTATYNEVSNPGNAYVLDIREGTGVGLYRLGENEKVGACEAYLQYSGSTACEFFPIPFTFANLQAKLSASSTDAKAPTVITLDRDVVAGSSDTKSLEVPQGHHAVIDLNGHTIDRHLSAATIGGGVINVKNNSSGTNPATLTIRDSQGGGQITGGNTQAGGGGIFVSGSLTLEGGTICGNHANGHGGAVNISGTFTMKGGTITDNSCGNSGNGSAIYTNGGSIYLQGGTITGNKGSEAIYTDRDLNVSGNYDVSGNTLADGKTEAPDIVLVGKVINIAGAISPVHPATVAFASGGPTLTSGWSTYMSTKRPSSCFVTSDNDLVFGQLDDELVLGTPDAIYWHADDDHDGSREEKAYVIVTPDGLDYLAQRVNADASTSGKYFQLGADIDMSSISNFTPIGNFDHPFNGHFDGNGKTISGLTINRPTEKYVGLFGRNFYEVYNVILSGANITGSDYVGGIVGENVYSGSIENCFVVNTSVNSRDVYSGIIVGYYEYENYSYNYYHNCTVTIGSAPARTSNIGTYSGDINTSNAKNEVMQALALKDNADNSSVIDENNSNSHGVYLEGRTLYRDGGWNTLCLPFMVYDQAPFDQISFSDTPLEGGEARELTSSSFDSTTGQLTLTFSEPVTEIMAGKPYIIRWAEAATNIVNPLFCGVYVENVTNNITTDYVDFIGTYKPSFWETENRSILLVGAENSLYWPQSGAYLNSCRAYFQLKGITASEVQNARMVFGEDNSTGIVEAEANSSLFTLHSSLSEWYSLDGRKVVGKPTKKGMYIHGGRKVVVK